MSEVLLVVLRKICPSRYGSPLRHHCAAQCSPITRPDRAACAPDQPHRRAAGSRIFPSTLTSAGVLVHLVHRLRPVLFGGTCVCLRSIVALFVSLVAFAPCRCFPLLPTPPPTHASVFVLIVPSRSAVRHFPPLVLLYPAVVVYFGSWGSKSRRAVPVFFRLLSGGDATYSWSGGLSFGACGHHAPDLHPPPGLR